MRAFNAKFYTLAAVVLTALMAVPAGSALASPAPHSSSHAAATAAIRADRVNRPDSATECNPNPLESANECTSVVGKGLIIEHISGVTFSNVPFAIDRVHIQIYGPNGTLKNCPSFRLPGFGKGKTCLWTNPHPHIKVKAGNYCSKAWEETSTKPVHFTELSAECIKVKK
jgi:hypothetical protein